MAIVQLKDPDSGEVEYLEECPDCKGVGGYDVSNNCEVYDDWQDCQTCGGSGEMPLGFAKEDTFIPERDAFTPND